MPKISELEVETTVNGGDYLLVEQGGVTYRATINTLREYYYKSIKWTRLTGNGTVTLQGTYDFMLIGAGGGGGGGVGGGAGACDDSGGGGGASGHVKLFQDITGGSIAYVCGAGGIGGFSACNPGFGANGTKGGSTTITVGGTTYTAKGGNGGIAGTRSNNPGGEGGSTNTSDGFNIAGGNAGRGCNAGGQADVSGATFAGTPGIGGSADNEGGGGGGGAPAGINFDPGFGWSEEFYSDLGAGGEGGDKGTTTGTSTAPTAGQNYAAGGGGGSRCRNSANGSSGVIYYRFKG